MMDAVVRGSVWTLILMTVITTVFSLPPDRFERSTGGSDADAANYPYLASITAKRTIAPTLVAKISSNLENIPIGNANFYRIPDVNTDGSNLLISAAHIFCRHTHKEKFAFKRMDVTLRKTRLDEPPTHKIKKVWCHPKFDRKDPLSIDVAIIQLDGENIMFGDGIQPVLLTDRKLPWKTSVGALVNKCTYASHGANGLVEEGETWKLTFPEFLQEVIGARKIQSCKINGKNTKEFCTQWLYPPSMIMEADSGAALVCKDGKDLIAVGIASHSADEMYVPRKKYLLYEETWADINDREAFKWIKQTTQGIIAGKIS